MGEACSPAWTPKMNKLFEVALAMYDEDTPDRWEVIAEVVGEGTTPDEVKTRYQCLVDDVERIETEDGPLPFYDDDDEDEDEDEDCSSDYDYDEDDYHISELKGLELE